MHNAVKARLEDPNLSPLEFITVNSPPIFLAYPLDTNTTNIHEPLHGITVLAAYDSLGIGGRVSLEYNINASVDPNAYKYLPDFALSVIETCPESTVEQPVCISAGRAQRSGQWLAIGRYLRLQQY